MGFARACCVTEKASRRSVRSGWLGLLALTMAAALLLAGCTARAEEVGPTPTPTTKPAGSGIVEAQNTVTVDGVTYNLRRDLKTILFLGVDNADAGDASLEEAEGDMIVNNGRADIIMLFIMDPVQKTAEMLSISRDTYIDLDVYKANGDFGYTVKKNLTMQYSYGNSDTRSCYLMKRKVSELLYGVPIIGTLALKMDGIQLLVEELGGITLTMPEDYTDIDPAYTAGAQITLDGPAAERFVRYRDTAVTGTAEQRLERDSWFMRTLFGQLKAKGGMASTMTRLMDRAEDHIQSDVDAETLQLLADCTLADETCKLPGRVREGSFHDEFIVDEDALQGLVLELFYEPAPAA